MAKAGIRIQTPRGKIVTYSTKNGQVRSRIIWNKNFALKVSGVLGKAQVFVDSEVLRHCDPYVPFLTGTLKKSGELGTQIGSGEVRYIAPYAYKRYRAARSVGKRGPNWFARMKADHGQEILNGAKKIIRGEK